MRRPRMNEPVKPARSLTTPPPKATTTESRFKPHSTMACQTLKHIRPILPLTLCWHRDNRNLIINLFKGCFSGIKVASSHLRVGDNQCFLDCCRRHASRRQVDQSAQPKQLHHRYAHQGILTTMWLCANSLHQHASIEQQLDHLVCNLANSATFGVHQTLAAASYRGSRSTMVLRAVSRFLNIGRESVLWIRAAALSAETFKY